MPRKRAQRWWHQMLGLVLVPQQLLPFAWSRRPSRPPSRQQRPSFSLPPFSCCLAKKDGLYNSSLK
ncbi:hypothetical protein OIU78_013030 [Salix suchowensis]|uniref:Uncharacterized protein n=1 Tax=Salix purpurea TaxID=77065 RepID=A0A9Q0QE16_SALPP|nr:hypothetical protein OIU78_013030 [Salix suchowensis]KAJ6704646.1 hypothetical protein OIU79_009545 [Salix purpurea]